MHDKGFKQGYAMSSIVERRMSIKKKTDLFIVNFNGVDKLELADFMTFRSRSLNDNG